MKRWLPLCLAAVLVAPLAACDIYFGDDDGHQCVEPPTFDGGGHRNPNNGACEPFGGGGGCAVAFDAISFDWGDCPSACEQLGEQACLASPDCHATYVDCAPGGDCQNGRMFNECWDLPPSGGNYGAAQCQGADAESCNRNADCVSNYHVGDSGEGYPGGGGPLTYDSCAPEGGNFQGCYSQADCPDGTVCTAETECLPPPDCMPGQACPDVCFGQCVPSNDACAGVDCGPGYHCEEQCAACDPQQGPCDPSCAPACVPDGGVCPIACPPNSECETVCGDCNDPTDPMCGECHAECVPLGGDACANTSCPMGQHCESECPVCDPPPNGQCPDPPVCFPECVDDEPPPPPPVCDDTTCMPGTHCEVECTMNADGTPHCQSACVPDGNACGAMDCPPGSDCVQTCTPPPPGCEGGPMGCPPVCTATCVPAQPATCETQTTAQACEAVAGCEPVFNATCTPNPDGTFTCGGFMFSHCQEAGATPPLPPPTPVPPQPQPQL
ncbi:MAG TPA: hypothetical protein VHE35_09995 [Kofleriaceae bacterium]|nr:hypothetical protein [Kofleriaceae bacterium]